MGTQKEIVKEIRRKKADYVLALKGNHGGFCDEVKQYFNNSEFLKKCAKHRTVEKARSCIEIREYWQSDDVKWLSNFKNWTALKSIIMTKNTIKKGESITTETRYFISSLNLDIKEVAKAIRSHWMVESYHWHLDVTFREDNDHTLEKQAAFNLNILRKLALNILKLLDVGRPRVSLRRKRKMIGWNPVKYFGELLEI
jgi:predicted transposase YbfD/YdcC